jgi:hypothetical protein
MTNEPNRCGIDPTEELPDRIAHRRKIAERLALDGREYGADGPSRTVDRAGSGHSAHRTRRQLIIQLWSRTPHDLRNEIIIDQ